MYSGFLFSGGEWMSQIKKVVPLKNYKVEVQLENGSSVILELESRLGTLRFGMLADEDFFKKVTTDGICIFWEDRIEISINELFQLVQK